MKTLRQVLALCGLMLALLGTGYAQEADVGLMQQLSGEVTYSGGKAKAYMKMRRGDRYSLSAGAQLRVVYFRNGRRETWRGPAVFRSGTEHGDALSGTVYEVADLPLDVPQKIQRIPDLIQIAKLGGVTVRGLQPKQRPNPEQRAEIAAARATYAELRRRLPQEDITPELYLFTVLQDYLLYDEMQALVDEMLQLQPADPEAQQLAEWVKTSIARSK